MAKSRVTQPETTDRSKSTHAGMMAPVQTFYQVFFLALDTTAQAYDPLLKSIARVQLETLGLLNRRTQAAMEVPARLANCRSPVDVFNEQVQFWKTAHQQGADAARKIFEAVVPLARQTSFEFDQEPNTPRDYITFPEYREATLPADLPEERRRVA